MIGTIIGISGIYCMISNTFFLLIGAFDDKLDELPGWLFPFAILTIGWWASAYHFGKGFKKLCALAWGI